MISVVIKGPSLKEAEEQIEKALPYADLVELRLDCFHTLDIESLRKKFSIPMIFKNELAHLKPEYIDLEEGSQNIPKGINLIISYHNFNETPVDLDAIYKRMQKTPAQIYKIAVMANNTLDALRLMIFAKSKKNLIAISMGPYGQISRILGPIIGTPITYACLDEPIAPGQVPAKTLIEQYGYRKLNPDTAIYGLIGHPVDKSISAITHNKVFKDHNAVYVKMSVLPEELPQFLELAKLLPFKGLSVTMPLKEHVASLVDRVEFEEIQAVNTVVFENDKLIGFNTDGVGALNAIEKHMLVKDKQLVVIGAGGSAKAIAAEAKKRGAYLIIINRNKEKAMQLARQLDCKGKGLDELTGPYDILINCTSSPMPISQDAIFQNALVMDINTLPKNTEFLKKAKEKGCRTISGYHMFIEQALLQFEIWFKQPISNVRKIIEEESQIIVSSR